MLENSLYHLKSLDDADGIIKAVIDINGDSKIFAGHFPCQPVLPGACMLQMLKEVLQKVSGSKLRLKRADQIKFLSPVDPRLGTRLVLTLSRSLSEDDIVVTASITTGITTCFKFKGIFVI